ncbi:MAG: response regulator transcription factor [Marinoscillum sp.]
MNVIIVDDEPRAIELIKGYLEHFSALELKGTFRNAMKAFNYIQQESIDLIFLDINMPDLSGISLSRMIDPTIKIVFTTAYSEYAVESYEVRAIDYLLKPISLDRFSKTISKVLMTAPTTEPKERTIQIKSGTTWHVIPLDQLLFLKKDGNYMTYYLNERQIIARQSVTEAIGGLPEHFSQCHKSYIFNKQAVETYDREQIQIGQHTIPIGESFREPTLLLLGK